MTMRAVLLSLFPPRHVLALDLSIDSAEVDLLADELELSEEISEWVNFDLFFGLLVLANSLFIGLNTSDPTEINEFFYAETAFLVLFTFEFCFRVCLSRSWAQIRRDAWMTVDLVLIGITAIDLLVMRWVDSSGSGNLTVLRVFR